MVNNLDLTTARAARNILLFSLILDDTNSHDHDGDDIGTHHHNGTDDATWNIYYELYLDNASLGLLEAQAGKLFDLSSSMEAWHAGPYGRILRICDSGTLALLREVWDNYSPQRPELAQQLRHQSIVLERCKKAMGSGDKNASNPAFGVSLQPCTQVVDATKDGQKLKNRFWEKENESLKVNPSLVMAATDTSDLHYGTDPLLGFHLLAAHDAPLVPDETHVLSVPSEDPTQHLKDTACLQFRSWVQYFRHVKKAVTLRFCASDALVFCYTYQYLNIANKTCANWPRHAYRAENLTLDNPDYYANEKLAPRFLNVIDTSNLSDRLGLLNIIAAAIPLLENDLCSTLYTEFRVKATNDFRSGLDDFLHGDFPSMSVLLGVFPVDYWTNACAVWFGDKHLLEPQGRDQSAAHTFHRQGWKLQLSQRSRAARTQPGVIDGQLHFAEIDLGQLLLKCYLMLFKHEDVLDELSKFMQGPLSHLAAATSLTHYHRANFAAFLGYVKGRVYVDKWEDMILALMRSIKHSKPAPFTQVYLQELCVYLVVYGVCSSRFAACAALSRLDSSRQFDDFRAWDDIPNIVNVTVRVPRNELRLFTKPGAKATSPLVGGFVQSKSLTWLARFASV